MWLTGFDVPSLHTMYIDKPMQGHTLMQAIARVNRVFRDKPGGLVVDYIGLGDELGKRLPITRRTAVLARLPSCRKKPLPSCWRSTRSAAGSSMALTGRTGKTPSGGSRSSGCTECFSNKKDGKKRFITAVTEISKAFALSVPHEEAMKIRDDVAFFQTVGQSW